jgi:GTP-binding protein EngB required for normal cell division
LLRPGDPLRLLLALLSLAALAALLYFGLALLERGLGVWAELQTLPAWLRYPLLGVGAGFALAGSWLAVRLLRGGPGRAPRAEPIDRARIEARLEALDALGAEAGFARAELAELDARRERGVLQLALFGDISAGKSSLLRALVPGADVRIDVRGGSTTEVSRHAAEFNGLHIEIADVPGTHGADGEALSERAREEAARAHGLLYVCDGDLTRGQDADLQALARFGRPVLLLLNKSDRYDPRERGALLDHLNTRYAALGVQVLPVSAGHRETLTRIDADGSEQRVERALAAELGALPKALRALAGLELGALEPAREAAPLAALDARMAQAEQDARAREAEAIVRRYTRRALVAALATVAPGTDLIIQGGLAAAMLHELSRLHGRSLRELDVDAFLKAAGGRVRSHSAVLLAIAGNGLKAFPGLGTLGGGLVHAVAYGLLFDALGRAAAQALTEGSALDRSATLDAFEAQLKAPRAEALTRLARLGFEALRGETETRR